MVVYLGLKHCNKFIGGSMKEAKEQQEKLPDQILYPIEDWQYQVKNGDTKLSYGEWVEHCTERDEV
jgi:hypothetical protein